MLGVVAVGNELRGDDGVGMWAGRLLKKRGFPVVLAHENPENFLGEMKKFDQLLILDAAHFEEDRPYVITSQAPDSFYTHKASLQKISKFTGAKTWLVGIKTYNRALGESVSEQAQANARQAVKVIEVCMAVPGKIIDGKNKIAEIQGKKQKVKFGVPGVKEGDFVMVHAGVVIEKLDPTQFDEVTSELEELGIC